MEQCKVEEHETQGNSAWISSIGIYGLPILAGLGTILGFVGWQIFDLIYWYVWKHYFVSLNINTTDPVYEWILLWLKTHGPLNDAQHWTVETQVFICS